MQTKKDFYLVLGIPRDADPFEVKRAYRKLVLELHPDQSGSPDSAARLREVQEAYTALNELPGPIPNDTSKIPFKRSPQPQVAPLATPPISYSQWRHGMRFDPEPFGSTQAKDLTSHFRHKFSRIDELLGGFVPEALPNRPPSDPKDLYVEMVLSKDEAAVGGSFPLTVPLHKPCKACLGSGLGGLTLACTRCDGHGYETQMREFELVVPSGVHDGQEAIIALSSDNDPPRLHVSVRLA